RHFFSSVSTSYRPHASLASTGEWAGKHPPARACCPVLSRYLERSLRAPALWRRGKVQLDRLAAGTRTRLGGELSGARLKDQRRNLLGAVDADPGAEHPAARAVATRLVRCQSEALAHHASTLAAARSIR